MRSSQMIQKCNITALESYLFSIWIQEGLTYAKVKKSQTKHNLWNTGILVQYLATTNVQV